MTPCVGAHAMEASPGPVFPDSISPIACVTPVPTPAATDASVNRSQRSTAKWSPSWSARRSVSRSVVVDPDAVSALHDSMASLESGVDDVLAAAAARERALARQLRDVIARHRVGSFRRVCRRARQRNLVTAFHTWNCFVIATRQCCPHCNGPGAGGLDSRTAAAVVTLQRRWRTVRRRDEHLVPPPSSSPSPSPSTANSDTNIGAAASLASRREEPRPTTPPPSTTTTTTESSGDTVTTSSTRASSAEPAAVAPSKETLDLATHRALPAPSRRIVFGAGAAAAAAVGGPARPVRGHRITEDAYIAAIRTGDVAVLDAFAAQPGSNIHCVDHLDKNALMIAAAYRQADAVCWCLHHGVGRSVDATSHHFWTAAMFACASGWIRSFDDENDATCLQLLVAAGADVNRQSRLGDTPLHVAGHCGFDGIVRYLVSLPHTNLYLRNAKLQTPEAKARANHNDAIADIIALEVRTGCKMAAAV